LIKKPGLESKHEITGFLGGIPIGDAYPSRIMGVINLTKNSFYPGSVRQGEKIIETALEMEQYGADLIDLGARSTAPYRTYDIPTEVEGRILKDAVRSLRNKIKIPISVDTTRVEVAKLAFSEGASILNDVYGLTQNDGTSLARLVARNDHSLILCAHERRRREGKPMERIIQSLKKSVNLAITERVSKKKIILDPGIGFFSDPKISSVEWNCAVISKLADLRALGFPLCVGVSRKKFIGKIGGDIPPDERLSGSLAATAIAIFNGCHMIRTHDVKETIQAVKVASRIQRAESV
jgi:dihydropteroate synthase